MSYRFEQTKLWRETLGRAEPVPEMERLRGAFKRMREVVALIAAEIHRDLPDFTVHDITHIDALWEVADTLGAGTLGLNPVEGFVLGGAFMLHDLGMGLAAWPDRQGRLERHPRWRDVVSALVRTELRRPTRSADVDDPPSNIRSEATRTMLRLLHAEHAEALPSLEWVDDRRDARHVLIEDEPLRHHLGPLIGRIAHSHWWPVEKLRCFQHVIGAPTGFPPDWTIDPLRIAAVMRTADAAHLDDRRAPRLLRVARGVTPTSRDHWVFQGNLNQLREESGRLVFSSARAFNSGEAHAWWLAYDALQMVDRELRNVDSLLADSDRTRLVTRSVAGANDPAHLAEYLPVRGWQPVLAQVRVGDAVSLVDRLGGRELYGDDATVALRELMQNARDALVARQVLQQRPRSWSSIIVRQGSDERGPWIEVEDSGVGMSKATLTGPLLDFGQTYWGTTLCMEEHTGLMAGSFEPVGKYGIGFFSAFMWGARVRVCTRRYDLAIADALSLTFEAGVGIRPVLCPAAAADVPADGGTRVRVWLSTEPTEPGGVLWADGGPIILEDLCGAIAPALDVNLDVQSRAGLTRVVAADDWKSMAPDALLQRINRNVKVGEWLGDPETKADVMQRFSLLRADDDTVIGRVAFAPETASSVATWQLALPGVVTVGGFRAAHVVGIAGVLEGQPTRADRKAAVPVVSPEMLGRWAGDAARRWRCGKVPGLQAEAAQLVSRCGGDCSSLYVASGAEGWLTQGAIRGLAEAHEEIVLVESWRLDYRTRPSDIIRLNANVVAVSSRTYPMLWGERGSNATWPQESDAKGDLSGPLARLVMNVIAGGWGVDVELLQTVRGRWTIGSYESDGEPRFVHAMTLRKPAT